MGDNHARFLLEDLIPKIGEDYSLVDHANGRVVRRMSYGGADTFTVIRAHPDAFRRDVSRIES